MGFPLRSFSWITAIIYMIFSVIGAILFAFFLAIPKDEEFVEEFGEVNNWLIGLVVVLLIYCLSVFGTSIALMVGLKQNRHELMKPFIYIVYAGILLTISISVRLFFRGLRKHKPAGSLALDLLSDLAVCAVQGVLLYPVYELYRKLKDYETETVPEQYTLSNNEPVHKPYYPIQQGGA
ncbi:uncharacterized protein LOC106090870 [Stomoxys calcitrans]|uniref:uncharacterized protein LOC106090870 n=1 Tax=Stomoxys calcitrans TaxID=35570 RepID=UPI0027E26C96|nr:uncharacterized protein LOC106090870 [Stomoxys calcitrans]